MIRKTFSKTFWPLFDVLILHGSSSVAQDNTIDLWKNGAHGFLSNLRMNLNRQKTNG
jgi:hypothetical protein